MSGVREMQGMHASPSLVRFLWAWHSAKSDALFDVAGHVTSSSRSLATSVTWDLRSKWTMTVENLQLVNQKVHDGLSAAKQGCLFEIVDNVVIFDLVQWHS